ncbi:MAG: histidine kinase [Bacteroidota bacterium]
MTNSDLFKVIIKREPIFHIVFWLRVLLFPYLKYIGKEGGYPNSLGHELNGLFFYILSSYFIYFGILQKQIQPKIPLIIIVFLLCAYGHEFFDSFFHPDSFRNYTWKQILTHLIAYGTFSMVFYAIHIGKTAYLRQLELVQLYEENQMANIAALKAQVTPHFLFNTLNSIYRKAMNTDQETANLILQLSDNMRYFLKQGQAEKVELAEEMEHINNYIQLQKQRWKNKLQVHFTQISTTENTLLVTPLLFIPFIENAFKYASELRGEGHTINITFSYQEGILDFICTNPFTEAANKAVLQNIESSKIGIHNTQRRLALTYPQKHELNIYSNNGIYMVNLKLIL